MVPFERAKKSNDDYFTIMFVRDPIRRFISGWNFAQARAREWGKAGISLDRAIRRLVKKDPFEVDKHFRPQWTFADGLRIDFMGQLEHMENDWLKVMDLVKVKPIEHLNGTRLAQHCVLSEANQKLLREYYKKDYQLTPGLQRIWDEFK